MADKKQPPSLNNPVEQYRMAFPAYKVFIFGVDVSEDVLAVNMTWHDGSSPNQCSITLNNELDKYIITTDDMLWLNRSTLDVNSLKIPWMVGQAPGFITDSNILNSNNGRAPFVISKVKQDVLVKKGSLNSTPVSMENRTDANNQPANINPTYRNYFGPNIDTYPISDGNSIFHPMDPIRVFFRDPFNPSRWYHMFCGFVSDQVDTSDENNAKSLTITAEDPTKLFRYTRVFRNPGILDASKVIQDTEIVLQSFWTNKFHDYSLPELVYTLMFGYDFARESIVQKGIVPPYKPNDRTLFKAIGHFCYDTSAICTLGDPPSPGSAAAQQEQEQDVLNGHISIGTNNMSVPILHLGDRLDVWQMLLDHEVQPTDLYMMATMEDRSPSVSTMNDRRDAVSYLTGGLDGPAEIDIEAVIDYIGTNPGSYPVDGGRVMLLLPRSLGASNSNIILKDIIGAYPLTSDSTTVGTILMETLARLEFSMYCSPKGDIVIEMPLYDFDPNHFGLTELKSDQVATSINQYGPAANFNPLVSALQHFPAATTRGPYGQNYVILKNDTVNWQNANVDEKVFTIAVSKRALFQNWDNLPFSDLTGNLSVAKREALFPIYGFRQAPVPTRGYIITDEGAKLYAEICLNRLNADAHTIQIQFVPNIKLWLNRPIYVQGRNAIATTKSITHSIVWGEHGDMSTTCELYACRTWKGDVDAKGNLIYTSINGYGTSLLNYAVLFGMAPPPNLVELPTTTTTSKETPVIPDDVAKIINGGF